MNEAEREKLLQDARDAYGSDDIEIDKDARLSESEHGTWVQAWVWLPSETLEDEADEDSAG